MTLSTYTGARADVAAALEAAFPTFTVWDHISDRIDNDTVMLLAGTATPSGPCRWLRELGVGVFVRLTPKDAGYDAIDAFTVQLRSTVETFARYVNVSPITDATIAGSSYLMQLHTIEIETIN